MNTVYIIGAGASHEVGLPTGDTLKDEIARTLYINYAFMPSEREGNLSLWDCFKQTYSNDEEKLKKIYSACQHIVKNLPLAISIDNLLDSDALNTELAQCGKIGIIESILKAERSSSLYFEPNEAGFADNMPNLQSTWYVQFFRRVFEGCSKDDLKERLRNITLIIFNYDRCVEHFLYHSMMQYFRLNEQECAALLNDYLKIIHPYGTVGRLPWQSDHNSNNTRRPFGAPADYIDIINSSDSIKTFSESEGLESTVRQGIVSNMAHAERIIFLGFAYHRMNMQLLSNFGEERFINQGKVMCLATTLGFSENDTQYVNRDIGRLYKNEVDIALESSKCCTFFQNNSRALSFDQ
ncbi:hypothetical protein [Idiomarina sp. MD25a]|uniref:hypothetical protein n=1 Tax=Idiomarina sp. MD25a TaxID=1889913 RepID=UPI00117B0262|nr:hypothetical protein [Idiomarina sp. MD25a]